MKISQSSSGFTLIELMLTLLIGLIIMAAIYSAYLSQQKTYISQSQVVEVQQNIRAGLEMMSSEIRMAGYDPTGNASASIINDTTPSPADNTTHRQIVFTLDLNGDGDTGDANEQVIYTINGITVNDGDNDGDIDNVDINGNGRFDDDNNNLTRETGGVAQTVAENIQAIEFYYTLEDDSQVLNPTANQLDKIKSVQISILAYADRPDQDFTNNMTYYPGSNPTGDPAGKQWGPYNDNLRRRMLTYNINCRNMGLN